jgi:hypothetical protein
MEGIVGIDRNQTGVKGQIAKLVGSCQKHNIKAKKVHILEIKIYYICEVIHFIKIIQYLLITY